MPDWMLQLPATNIRLGWKSLAMPKHSTLRGIYIGNDKGEIASDSDTQQSLPNLPWPPWMTWHKQYMIMNLDSVINIHF